MALDFMLKKGMLNKFQQIGPEGKMHLQLYNCKDIVNGNTKMILAVLWAIIRYGDLGEHMNRIESRPSSGELPNIMKSPATR